MANSIALGFSLCLLVLFNGCLATHQQQRRNECQLNQIQAREPDNRIESEAGLTESWNPNHQDLQCAGVAVVRRTIEPNGLHLPSYVNTAQLIHIIKGRGVLGVVLPGCPETFEESEDQQQQQSRRQGQQQGQSSQDQPDRHQKIRHIREGDVIALPAGVAHWSYNHADQPLVAVSFLDLSNPQNQLDNLPRRFYLAGNPTDEFNQGQQQRRQQQGQQGQREQQQQGRRERGQQQGGNNNNNVYSGFDTQLLAKALNVDEETARNLQGQNDNRNDIVRVQGQLDFVSPLTRSSRRGGRDERQQEERQRERQQEEREREREQQRREGGGGNDNLLNQNVCQLRLQENLGDPSRADFYSPQAGRIATLNRNNLPILRQLRLSAERGVLYNNAIYSPHWNLNANELVYVVRGEARVQVVNENGDTLLDDNVREGQLFLVPQNHAAIKQASNEGFEYVSMRTNDNAVVNTLAGRTSVLRALPDQVLQNAYQISRRDAMNLKYNRQETRVLSASSSSSRRSWMSILG